ncbi:hypothetical protein QBC37DRAFT_142147 [Rhypophila decipiens]|uniref:Uncharacterized protein n=1 Tax=Rhypophila decipiens TaxID=261697 RepID=A0AAN6YBL6_9PEZI|nr:hypothetical protein QBC37DRAFT_142147 [Rhypophila decipiens]
MYQLPQLKPAGGNRTRSNSTATTATTTTSTTTALPSSTGWIPHIWKKTCIIQQDFRMEENTQMSIFYNVMPDSLRNRIPPIPSFRRKVSGPRDAATTAVPGATSSTCSSPAVARATTPTTDKHAVGLFGSPFSSGCTTPVSDAETAVMHMSEASSEADTDQQTTPDLDAFAFADARNLASSMSMLPPAPENNDTGINWRCGAQGFGLVISSAQESRSRRSDDYNSCFERSSYIDGVQYMLQGLPRDLDPTEAAILRRSMPPALSDSLSSKDRHHSHRKLSSDPYVDGTDKTFSRAVDDDRNLVHSLLLFVLIYMKNWMLWVMPYVLLLSGEVISFEREHNIAGMVLSKCMAGMSASLRAIKAMSHGPLGQYLGSVLEYFAEGVSGALQEFAKDWFAGMKFERDLFRGNSVENKYSKLDEMDGSGGGGGCYGYGQPGYGYGRQQQQCHGQGQQPRLRTRMR